MTPAAVPRLRGAAGRPQRQPARRPRRRGEDRGQVDHASTARSTTLVDQVDEIKGKAGDALREHLADVMRNRRLTELVRDVPLAGHAGRPARRASGTASRCTRCSTRWSSGCCASGCSPSTPARRRRAPRPRPASTSTSRPGEPGAVGPWLAEHAPARRAHRARRRRAPGAAAPATSPALALASADGAAALRRPGRARPPTTTAALAALARRPDPAQGAARRQGPVLGAAAPAAGRSAGLTSDTALAAYLVRPDQRTFDLADLDAALSSTASCGPRRTDGGRAAHSRRRPDDAGDAEALDGRAPGPCSTSPTRSTASSSERGGDAAAARRRAAARARARRHGAGRHRRRHRPPGRWRPSSPRDGAARPRSEAHAARRPRVQPRLAQAAAGRCCSTSSACRRPSGPRPATRPTPTRWPTSTRKTEHPLLEQLLRHRDVSKLRSDRRRVCCQPSPTTAASTPPSTRPWRRPAGCRRTDPNLQNIPIRTEEGRRIRAGVRRRRAATSAC